MTRGQLIIHYGKGLEALVDDLVQTAIGPHAQIVNRHSPAAGDLAQGRDALRLPLADKSCIVAFIPSLALELNKHAQA